MVLTSFSAGPTLQNTTPIPASMSSEAVGLSIEEVITATPRTSLSISFRSMDFVRAWSYWVLQRMTSNPRSQAAAWNPRMISGKYGLAISEITRPNKSLRPVANRRACTFLKYFICLTTSKTRLSVSTEMYRVLLRTRETVAGETPARLATSLIVWPMLFLREKRLCCRRDAAVAIPPKRWAALGKRFPAAIVNASPTYHDLGPETTAIKRPDTEEKKNLTSLS